MQGVLRQLFPFKTRNRKEGGHIIPVTGNIQKMADSKKIKYLTKTVTFGGSTLTLFSIDGSTWSTRKQELLEIKERQERDKVSFAAIKEENGNTRVVANVKSRSRDDSEEEESPDLEAEAEDDLIEADYSLDEERQPKVKRRGRPSMKSLPVKAAKTEKPVLVKAKKKPLKEKAKKPVKVAPKKRASAKPKAKAAKAKQKSKKKAA